MPLTSGILGRGATLAWMQDALFHLAVGLAYIGYAVYLFVIR